MAKLARANERENGINFILEIMLRRCAGATLFTESAVAKAERRKPAFLDARGKNNRKRKDGMTKLNKLDTEQLADWLQDYTLSQVWESNLFGGRP